MTTNGRLMTTGQVAHHLGLHLRKIQRLAESGELAYAQKLPGISGRYLFEPATVEQWARQNLAEARPA